MGLLSGLEKFGLSADQMDNLFEEDKKTVVNEDGEEVSVKAEPVEADFLLSKVVRCKMCDKTFPTLQVKTGRVKRLESDQDLRPRYQYIDTLKYSIISCPYCGYTGVSRNIENITSVQRKLLMEQICEKFTGGEFELPESYSYDEAIERYKLALFNSIAKKDKDSEKAWICLCISWLLRGKAESLPNESDLEKQIVENTRKDEETFYRQAYEGLMKSFQNESFPMCGMDEGTMTYLMSVMSYKLGKLDVASKFLQSILTSQSANRRMKDKALDLKDQIIAEIKAGKTGQ